MKKSASSQVRAAIYTRISSDRGGDRLGVTRQRADCEDLAERLGWQVLSVFEDNDVSASKARPRPAYERMMSDVEAGRINAVLVWDTDRLSRTPRELEDIIDRADRLGLRLASVGGDIDLGTAQGRMMARMKGTLARYEVEQSSRRIRRKHLELAQAGKHVGPRPFGWDVQEDGTLTVNRAEAAVVRECVQRALAGEGLWRIVNDLNARGVRTTKGNPWQTQVLRRMLLRWRNCGVRSLRGEEVAEGAWPAIIDRPTHERVVALLTDPARRSNNRGTAPKYLLTSVAYCGECGRYVVGVKAYTYRLKSGRERHYPAAYKCPHAGCMKVVRGMADVDQHVSAVVVGILERDGVRVFGGDPVAEEEARERAAGLEAQMALAADRFSAGAWTAEQVDRVNAAALPALEAARRDLRAAQASPEMQRFTGASAGQAWAAADVETRKAVIRALGLRIVINRIGPGNGGDYDPDSVNISATPRD